MARAKTLTESEAWTLLAEACESPLPHHSTVGHILDIDGIPADGICRAITALVQRGHIDTDVVCSMRDNLKKNEPPTLQARPYWFDFSLAGYRQRAAVCRKLARETAPKKRKKVSK